MRTRGRPRKADERDRIIARTVHKLLMWGFTGRSNSDARDSGRHAGVYEIVGKVARRLLSRTDDNGLELGPDRIEQLYEKWDHDRPEHPWYRDHRWRWTKASLIAHRPHLPVTLKQLRAMARRKKPVKVTQKQLIERYAEILLKHNGRWPWKSELSRQIAHSGDRTLTPRARSSISFAPLTPHPPKKAG